ncbi:MAG: hypothetical protein JAY74_28950 [Candidatus Thiodiazotropha taylori]|nr:hypothetical protein [Candidatus Thiodiazotropha taylori]
MYKQKWLQRPAHPRGGIGVYIFLEQFTNTILNLSENEDPDLLAPLRRLALVLPVRA